MKKLTLIIAITLATIALSKAQEIIHINENFVTQLKFSSNISIARFSCPYDFTQPQVHNNILLIQPLGSFQPSNISIICDDGSTYSIRLNYTINQNTDTYNFGTTAIDQETKPTTPDKNITENILQSSGFLYSRNTAKNKSTSISITGIYTHLNDIYIRTEINNNNDIPYKLETVVFSLSPMAKKKQTTLNPIQLEAKEVYISSHEIQRGKIEAIYKFDRFTIGNDYKLLIECIEQGGGRNLALTITDNLFLSAKSI